MNLIDVFITTAGRQEMFKQSLESFLDNTERRLFRLTIVADGKDSNNELFKHADYVLWHNERIGLGPSINQALMHISTLNTYFDNKKSSFICMCQDDVEYKNKWLEKLIKIYNLYSRKYNIGFVTGHNAPEHKIEEKIKFGKDELYLKPWIRATNMMATTDYFLSMYPISRMDPETGRERARPHGGMGSSVDWWFIRNHPNSVCESGRINLVWPGLIKHIGYDQSTWLDRVLPED